MKVIWPEPGKYIVAVSGGVDSVCLLDLLIARGGYELVVAHVDHGIRGDSALDLELVQRMAEDNSLYIVYTTYNFTKQTSEQQLRQARYGFLFEQMHKHDARGIITGHHADDLLETSIMNIRRGTDRYGAAGGMNREGIMRPLIKVSKSELISYAQKHHLSWHEDSTNTDLHYTRNMIRHEVVPEIDRIEYQQHLTELGQLNKDIDSELAGLVSVSGKAIIMPRSTLRLLSLRELEVLLAYAIRQTDPEFELSQPQVARLAREILLDTTKNSFSLRGTAGIIIDIQ